MFLVPSACMYVCNTKCFKSLNIESSCLVCESSSYMKVIKSRSRSQKQKAWNYLFRQWKSSIGNNSGSVENKAEKCACIVRFLLLTNDRMVWPPSLSRDRKYTHSRVICVRLEDSLVTSCTVMTGLMWARLDDGPITVQETSRRLTHTRVHQYNL